MVTFCFKSLSQFRIIFGHCMIQGSVPSSCRVFNASTISLQSFSFLFSFLPNQRNSLGQYQFLTDAEQNIFCVFDLFIQKVFVRSFVYKEWYLTGCLSKEIHC